MQSCCPLFPTFQVSFQIYQGYITQILQLVTIPMRRYLVILRVVSLKMIKEEIYHTTQIFSQIPSTGTRETIFNDCTFKGIDFTEFSFFGCDFVNCKFIACNLSMVKFGYIGFDDTYFTDCKLIGADFTATKEFLFNVHFTACILDYVAFMKKKNRKAKFVNCSLKGTDFSEADLTLSVFRKCDLTAAVFMRTTLNQVDFVEAYNFSIDPEQNQIRKAKFATDGLVGLLHKYAILVVP